MKSELMKSFERMKRKMKREGANATVGGGNPSESPLEAQAAKYRKALEEADAKTTKLQGALMAIKWALPKVPRSSAEVSINEIVDEALKP